jgi:amino acid adenylation domain-containing protein
LPALFAAQAARTPEAVALVCEDQSLTYAALAARINQLARFLIARGVGPDCIVPIAFERSFDMVVAILGIVTAGGAWLPIDTEAPAARVNTILADSGAPLILTSAAVAAGMAFANIEVSRLDDPALVEDLAKLSTAEIIDRDRLAPLLPHHLAYVIYTSGTTGKPKGVANTHEAIVNCLGWMRETIGIGPGDRVLQRVDYTFDVSIWDFFLPLISGGALIIARPGGHRDSSYVASVVQADAITLLFFVPTMLLDFLQDENAHLCTSIRNVVAIGEALSGQLQAKFHATLPHATLWNSYGPTEAAVGVTLWRCRREDGDRPPPIGEPCWNSQLYVLDPDLRPVPAGVSGELFIAGLPLARGYHGQPALTAEKFLACPFGPEGARMYRTGDVVQRRSDGEINFLGRVDSQIKFNGIRIEPGDIEAAISALPGIARSVVIARTLPQGARLIGYLVMKPGSPPPEPGEIRTALSVTLPGYMIPSFFVFLDQLPLAPSGKLDARALPDPDQEQASVAYRAPTNVLEALLATVFGELTNSPHVGVDHSFFELGGTSLTAMRLAARLKGETGLVLPMHALVDNPTPAGLAAALQRVQSGGDTLAVGRTDSRPTVFMFPGAGGSDLSLGVLCSACAARVDLREMLYPDWRQLCVPGGRFEDVIDTLAHEVATQAPSGELRLSGYSTGGDVAYGVARALRRMDREVKFVGVIDTPAPASARPAAAEKQGLLTRQVRKLARLWREQELTKAIIINVLGLIPLRAWPVADHLLPLLPEALRESAEERLRVTSISILEQRWVKEHGVPAQRLDAPVVLFRVRDVPDEDDRFAGWSNRAADLASIEIDGDHLTVLKGANLASFAARFTAAILSHRVSVEIEP